VGIAYRPWLKRRYHLLLTVSRSLRPCACATRLKRTRLPRATGAAAAASACLPGWKRRLRALRVGGATTTADKRTEALSPAASATGSPSRLLAPSGICGRWDWHVRDAKTRISSAAAPAFERWPRHYRH